MTFDKPHFFDTQKLTKMLNLMEGLIKMMEISSEKQPKGKLRN